MIAPVTGAVTAPALAPTSPVLVAPVTPVAAAASLSTGSDREPDGARRDSARREAARMAATRTVPERVPEPVSTQSVLLLRQNGSSVAAIADAYGISVDDVRRLMQPEHAAAGSPEGGAAL